MRDAWCPCSLIERQHLRVGFDENCEICCRLDEERETFEADVFEGSKDRSSIYREGDQVLFLDDGISPVYLLSHVL